MKYKQIFRVQQHIFFQGRVQIFDNLAKIKDNNIDIYTWIEDEKSQKKKEKVNLELNMVNF